MAKPEIAMRCRSPPHGGFSMIELGRWVRARWGAIQDALVVAAVFTALGTAGTFVLTHWGALMGIPPVWIDRATGALVAFAATAVVVASVIGLKSYRTRALERLQLSAEAANVPRGIIDFMADAYAASFQMNRSLTRSAKHVVQLGVIAARAAPRFQAENDPTKRRTLAKHTARKFMRVARRLRPVTSAFCTSVDII